MREQFVFEITPLIDCACGCGEKIKAFSYHGHKKIMKRFKHNHNSKGINNPAWNGGRYLNWAGYVFVYHPNHPRAHNNHVREHILVMEKHLGRYLNRKESVHHKD